MRDKRTKLKRNAWGDDIMKKILHMILSQLIFLSLCVCLSSVAFAEEIASGTCGDNLTWVFDNMGTLSISGSGEMDNYERDYLVNDRYTMPWDSYRKGIKKVVIEDGVESIGNNALTICNNLTSVDLADSVRYIGTSSFSGCFQLEEISLPEGLISIGEQAFNNCFELSEITIPANVESIGSNVFYACNELKKITVSDLNEAYCSVDGVLFNADKTEIICYPPGRSGSYVIPEGTTSISNNAFHGSFYLNAVSFPSSMETIGEYAFCQCYQLSTVSIPSGVSKLEEGAFSTCWGLESLTVSEGLDKLGNYAFSGCSNLTTISLPFSIKAIGSGAFAQCNNLEDVYYNGTEAQWKSIRLGNDSFTSTITLHYKYIAEGVCGAQGDNLTWILYNDGTLVISGTGDMTSFENGKPWDSYIGKVKTITIEPGVTSIGASMYSFSGITSFIVPEGIKTIGSSAFSNCSQLATIYLPSSLTNISGNAFVECRALRDIYFNGTKAQWNAISKPEYLLSNAELHLAVLSVSFNANGGSGVMDQQIADRGATFSLNPNSYIREGYYFIGWNTKPDGSGIAFRDQDTVNKIDEDLILYAQWKSTVTIIFDPNGGSGSMAPQVVGGSNVALSHNQFIREDYSFVGWNTRADGSGVFFNDATIVSVDEITSSTLFAQWEKTVFTIRFFPNGGSGTMEPQKFEKEKAFVLHPNTFVNENMFFMEWNTRADGSGTSYTDKATIDELDMGITLYALWAYGILFDGNGSTAGSMDLQLFLPDKPVTLKPNTFTRNNYSFKCWSTTSSGDGTLYSDSDTITLTMNMTLYAQWQKATISSVVISGSITGNDQTAIWGETLTAVVNDDDIKSGFSYAWRVGDDIEQQGSSNTYSVKQSDYGKQITCVISHPQVINQTESNFKVVGAYAESDALMIINNGNTNYPYSKPAFISGVIPGGSYNKDGTAQFVPASATDGVLEITEPGVYTFESNSYKVENWFTVGYTISPRNGSGTILMKYGDFALSRATRIRENGKVILSPYFGMLDGYTSIWIVKEGYGDNHISCTIRPATGSHAYFSLNDGIYSSTNGERIITLGTINTPMLYSIKFYKSLSPITDAPLILPAALTEIGDEAFAGSAFTYVRLPENAVSIGWHAFADCPNLSSIYIPEQTTQINEEAFGDKQSLNILGVPGSAAETFAIEHGFAFYLAS